MPWPLKAMQVAKARRGEISGTGQPENWAPSILVPRTVRLPLTNDCSWKLRTSMFVSLANSRERYSTWTPAPP